MKINKQSLVILFLILSSAQVNSQISILSGPEKGSYNRFVSDIVTVLGEKNGINLINKTTGGSAYNFKSITEPGSSFKIALIQSDYMNLMVAEDKLNNTNKTGSLKILMPLATEEIHFIAKKSSGLKKLQDLNMKKVGIGNEDQGSFATGKIIKERSKVFWYPYEVGFGEMLKELSAGKIDAGLMVGSAPIDMLDIDPQVMIDGFVLLELDDFNGWARYYENDTIYQGDYKWLEHNIPTFGVRTLLVVNESKLTSEEKKAVAAVQAGIIQNLDYLKKQGHPKWKTVIIPDDPDVTLKQEAPSAKEPEPVVANNPVVVDNKDAVSYRVQIYSRNYQREEEAVTINGKNYKPQVYSYLGAYRYTIGEFTSLSDATAFQKSCREAGYSQAFVAAFKNNVRSTDPNLFK
jgi:TRAP transporter TAXI family solute receptor